MSAQKEYPLIYSTQNVKRILNGMKTQTRRTTGLKEINKNPDAWERIGYDQSGRFSFRWIGGDRILNVRCPYGGVGDMLWVRETFAKRTDGVDQILFKAQYTELIKMLDLPEFDIIWKPSIFMFKKDARIWLELTEQPRLERVQCISEEDAKAEGITDSDLLVAHNEYDERMGRYDICYADAYARQWDELHGKEAWEKNEWVWVLTHNAFGVRLK